MVPMANWRRNWAKEPRGLLEGVMFRHDRWVPALLLTAMFAMQVTLVRGCHPDWRSRLDQTQCRSGGRDESRDAGARQRTLRQRNGSHRKSWSSGPRVYRQNQFDRRTRLRSAARQVRVRPNGIIWSGCHANEPWRIPVCHGHTRTPRL